MILNVGTPVFQARLDRVRYGIIEEKSKTEGGWQFYRVFWATENRDPAHYRADKLKVLNVTREQEKLQSVQARLKLATKPLRIHLSI